MAQYVADFMWKMLEKAGVRRCYGIVGDALNPVIDALRRNRNIDFVQVRHEEYGVFAAVASAPAPGTELSRVGSGTGVRKTARILMTGPTVFVLCGQKTALALFGQHTERVRCFAA